MSFNQQSSLFQHTRGHKGFRPFKCDLCDKAFVSSFKLAEHVRTHTGEKPYACDVCEKKFCHKDNLRVHKNMHRGVKPRRTRKKFNSKDVDERIVVNDHSYFEACEKNMADQKLFIESSDPNYFNYGYQPGSSY